MFNTNAVLSASYSLDEKLQSYELSFLKPKPKIEIDVPPSAPPSVGVIPVHME